MSTPSLRQFSVFFNPYYWQTAILIARNGLARQYRNSFLGILWTILQPFTMVMVYAFIMPFIMRGAAFSNYLLYIIVSLPVWTYFFSTLVTSSQSILSNGETLKRCMVSSTLFPVADVLRNTYMMSLSFGTMYSVALVLGKATLSYHLLLLPFVFLPVLVIILSAATAIAFIAPYVRDIGELINIVMTITFWLTPVFYSIDTLPPDVAQYVRWNPFYIMLHPIQMLVFGKQIPDVESMLRLLTLMVIAIVVSFSIFRVCRRNYVYYL